MLESTAVVLMAVLLLFQPLEVTYMNKNPLKDVKTYDIYYGSFDEENIEKYSEYDLLIIEPLHYTKDMIYDFKQTSDTIFIGYQSIFEVASWNKDFVDKMNDDDILVVNGMRVQNETYGNYVGDIREKRYRDLIVSEIGKNIVEKGFDGVFFDTVDWIDYFHEDFLLNMSLLAGYKQFLKELRREYPNLYFIQNRSFQSLNVVTKEYIQGVVWENFEAEKLKSESLHILLNVLKHQLKHNLKVFVISHEDLRQNRGAAKLLHWVYMNSKYSYDLWH